MILTKSKITEHLFENLQLKKKDSKNFVEFFFETIKKSLEDGENVKFYGFGNFELKYKKARPGKNLRTGQSIVIRERNVVTFKASKKLKNIVSSYLNKENCSL